MMDFSIYLQKRVKIRCTDETEFTGEVLSYGGSVQGEEEYGTAEPYISVYTGDGCYVLFEHEVKEIVME